MSLDLTLEEKDVMDYVQGKISESPSLMHQSLLRPNTRRVKSKPRRSSRILFISI